MFVLFLVELYLIVVVFLLCHCKVFFFELEISCREQWTKWSLERHTKCRGWWNICKGNNINMTYLPYLCFKVHIDFKLEHGAFFFWYTGYWPLHERRRKSIICWALWESIFKERSGHRLCEKQQKCMTIAIQVWFE